MTDYFYDDDYDEAEQAIWAQQDDDSETVREIQIHRLSHAMRSRLPGVSVSEEFRYRFGVTIAPFPADPTPGQLRNWFRELSYDEARHRTRSENEEERWLAATFLSHRNAALGVYCYNTNCLKPLEPTPKRRGRPRLYCAGKCKESGKSRHARNAANPHRVERLSPMLRPGHPFPINAHKLEGLGRGFTPPITDAKPPWQEPQSERTAPEAVGIESHLRRWHAPGRKSAPDSIPLAELVRLANAAGHIFSDDEREALEALLGSPLGGVILVDDDPPADPLE